MKTIDIKGKAYIEVNERLKEFRTNEKYKGFTLESEIVQLENGVCTIKAIIKDANDRIIATGYAQEKENSSFINKTSYIENCETSAWGRALGNLGIGIDTSIASADEVLNAMENQKEQFHKQVNKPLTAVEEIYGEEDNDLDLITGLAGISDMKNLEIYYKENKDKVIDKQAFNTAVKARQEALKEGA